MIKGGAILVGNKIVKPHYFLSEGEEVEVDLAKGDAQETGRQTTVDIKKIIVHEDKDFFIVNKPAGLLVHPTDSSKEQTLSDLLSEKYPEIKDVGDDLQRPGIVHRLDREVSGLLVVAKTQGMFDHLKDQFARRKVKKEYIGLVYGKIESDSGEINFPVIRSVSGSGKMAARPNSGELQEGEKTAITKYEIVKRYPQYTLVKLCPLTGRTHQLRVHLKAFGHSIVGDELYKNKKQKIKEELGRIFLQATHLAFEDLAGVWREFHVDLSLELGDFLGKLPE